MELRDYIAIGTAKAGTLTELGRIIGLTQQEMTNAKGHRRGLPSTALIKLQEYIEGDLKSMIAANELVTEKKPEKRAFWLPFVNHAKAASFAGFLITASVLNLLTPTPAEASIGKVLQPAHFVLCKLRRKYYALRLKQSKLLRSLEKLLKSPPPLIAMRFAKPKPI